MLHAKLYVTGEKNNYLTRQPHRNSDKVTRDKKQMKIFLLTVDNKLVSILALKVEPEPHVIDQTFRFHQPEQSFLKKSIRLPPFHNMVGHHMESAAGGQLVVRCSDENVICESYKRMPGEPQDVYIKVTAIIA